VFIIAYNYNFIYNVPAALSFLLYGVFGQGGEKYKNTGENKLLWSFTVFLLPNIFTMLNSKRAKLAGHVAEIGME